MYVIFLIVQVNRNGCLLIWDENANFPQILSLVWHVFYFILFFWFILFIELCTIF